MFEFTKMDHSKDGKNYPHYDGYFSNITVAVVTSNYQAKTVTKALVDRWFHIYKIPSRINNNWVKYMKYITSVPYMGSSNLKQSHISSVVFLSVMGLIELYMTCLKCCLSHKTNWSAHLNSLVFVTMQCPVPLQDCSHIS